MKINPWDALSFALLVLGLALLLVGNLGCDRPIAIVFNDEEGDVRRFVDEGDKSGTLFHFGQLGWPK